MRLLRFVGSISLLIVSLIGLSACRKMLPAPSLDPSALTVICLGDSITAGTHSDGDDGQLAYPALLQKILQEYRPQIQVINEGQDGWQVDDVSAHVQTWLTPASPDAILLQIGTNDLEQGATPDEVGRRLDILVTQIQQIAPKSHLYIASCTRVRTDNRPKLSLTLLEDFNNLVPKIAKDHEGRGRFVVYVDLFKRAGLEDVDFGPDGEHPNDTGYQKIAEYWSWELQRHEASSLHQTIIKKEVSDEQ